MMVYSLPLFSLLSVHNLISSKGIFLSVFSYWLYSSSCIDGCMLLARNNIFFMMIVSVSGIFPWLFSFSVAVFIARLTSSMYILYNTTCFDLRVNFVVAVCPTKP